MTNVLAFPAGDALRRGRETRAAIAAAQEPAFVTRYCGFLFAPTPWRDYRSQPPSRRLLDLRKRKALARIVKAREERRALRAARPDAERLQDAIVGLHRYYNSLRFREP